MAYFNRYIVSVFSAFLLLCVSIGTFAQDETYFENWQLPEPPQTLISPEILPDNRVTFRLYAPDALAVSVSADCFGKDVDTSPFGTSKGEVSMTKDNSGVWSYTTKYPVYPNCYTYDYLVDFVHNVIDPANPNDAWNMGSQHSVFVVGSDSVVDLYLDSKNDKGVVEYFSYYSAGMQKTRRVAVYLPPHYDSSRTYPVLYLLHGISGDERAWLSLGRTAQICDNMIAAKKIREMVVVMPNCNVNITDSTDGVATLTDNIMNIPKQLGGSFETNFYELIDLINSRYSISDKVSDHAIAGLSSGGFQAANIANVLPDYFYCIGLFSATLWKKQVPPVVADGAAQCYFIRMGRNDWVSWSLSMHFAERVIKKNYKVDIKETVGGHSWKWWRVYLVDFLPTLFN